jgi:hypothetical protein
MIFLDLVGGGGRVNCSFGGGGAAAAEEAEGRLRDLTVSLGCSAGKGAGLGMADSGEEEEATAGGGNSKAICRAARLERLLLAASRDLRSVEEVGVGRAAGRGIVAVVVVLMLRGGRLLMS